jgi:hypothetical protein
MQSRILQVTGSGCNTPDHVLDSAIKLR